MVEVSCREVLREISNYIEGDLDAGLRAMLERHFAECRHCAAVLSGARNIMVLSGDDRSFTLPSGFSQRLKEKLLPRTRGARKSRN
jgi:anti-sigma factor RsiW